MTNCIQFCAQFPTSSSWPFFGFLWKYSHPAKCSRATSSAATGTARFEHTVVNMTQGIQILRLLAVILPHVSQLESRGSSLREDVGIPASTSWHSRAKTIPKSERPLSCDENFGYFGDVSHFFRHRLGFKLYTAFSELQLLLVFQIQQFPTRNATGSYQLSVTSSSFQPFFMC